MSGELQLVIVSQEDSFFLPAAIEPILKMRGVRVTRIILVDSGGSLTNRKFYFVRNFGLCGSLKLALKYLGAALINGLDRLTGYALPGRKRSLRGLAKKYGRPCIVTGEISAPAVYDSIAEEPPHLILSFSAPQVFKEPLLSLPRYGLLNVHGSLLPDYRGIMPSFWVLANGENFTGASIHRISERIDEGEILFQEKVDLAGCKSMFGVIAKTKEKGGEIALKALHCFCNHPEEIRFKPNPAEMGRYFGWPEKEDIKRFYSRGCRLA